MKQFVFGLAVGLAVVSPASATSYLGMPGNAAPPAVVAGSVNYQGIPVGGTGFRVEHLGTGEYQVRFQNDRIRGCASMIASVDTATRLFYLAAATQVNCSRAFDVTIGYQGQLYDENFHFIVVQE